MTATPQTASPSPIPLEMSAPHGAEDSHDHGLQPCEKNAVTAVSAVRRNPILTTPPGSLLHGCTITEADTENEHRIARRFLLARACEAHKDIAGARLWTSLMQKAIKARRPEVVTAWEVEERRLLDEGVGFFSSDAAQAMGRRVE